MKKLIVPGLFIFVFLLVLLCPTISVLSVYNRKKPSICYYSRNAYKYGFEISYTHSVNKGRVHDIYQITKDNKLLVNDSIFVSYGAGIPEPEETPGAEFIVLENGYKLTNINRIVPKLTMAVGIIANHNFTIYGKNNDSNKTYIATELFLPQTSIILQIKKVSPLMYWLKNI